MELEISYKIRHQFNRQLNKFTLTALTHYHKSLDVYVTKNFFLTNYILRSNNIIVGNHEYPNLSQNQSLIMRYIYYFNFTNCTYIHL